MTMSSNHGYCKITKNGTQKYGVICYFEKYDIWDYSYDYGANSENLSNMIRKSRGESLYIIRLNDLGYFVSDVLDILDMLMSYDVRLFIDGKEVELLITYDSINYHFQPTYYINFDKYSNVIVFKSDIEKAYYL